MFRAESVLVWGSGWEFAIEIPLFTTPVAAVPSNLSFAV
jgi:hypothetical protein